MKPDYDAFKNLIESADAVDRAIADEGICPRYHRRVAAKLKKEWPTLWNRIQALRAALGPAKEAVERGDSYANFGRAFVAKIGTDDWWWHNEWSEDVMPLAVQSGIAERVPYDPEIHGEDVEAEPGDEIWVWLPIPPKENTENAGKS